MGDERFDHPILPMAWEYRIVGLRLELAPADADEPCLDLTLQKGQDVRRLRFWSPVVATGLEGYHFHRNYRCPGPGVKVAA